MKEETKAPEEKVEVKEEATKPEAKAEELKEEKKVEDKEVKEPEKKPDKKEPEEAKVDVEALKNELAEATERAKQVEVLSTEVATLKETVAHKESELKEYEDLLGNMVEAKMKSIPEDLKDLIPDNMNLKQKLGWLEKAEAKGIFNKEAKKKPNVEVGKPMNTEAPAVDTSKLTGSSLMRLAYSQSKK